MHHLAMLALALILLTGCGSPAATQAPAISTATPGEFAAPTPIPAGAAALGATPTPPPAPAATATNAPPTAIPATEAPLPTSVIPPITQMARDLATIEGVIGDGEKILQIAGLLRELDAGYTENEQEIGDATAQAYALLKQNNMPASIIDIMTEMRETLDLPGITNQSYRDMVTGWLVTQGVQP